MFAVGLCFYSIDFCLVGLLLRAAWLLQLLCIVVYGVNFLLWFLVFAV